MGAFDQLKTGISANAVWQRAILADRVSHAWLFTGQSAADLLSLAQAFAAALQCTDRPEGTAEACMHCKSCLQASDGNHPDILVWPHEKPKVFSIDEVRAMVSHVCIRPFSSQYKVYIVPDAHLMRPDAQNALLKTIEEPPSYAVIMLLTNNVEKMYSTIRSRCVTLNLRSVDPELITRFLMEKHQVPDYRAKTCSAYSQGNVGKALQMASSERFSQMLDFVQRLVRGAKDMKPFEIVQTAREMEAFQEDFSDLLDLIALWYRDILAMKTTGDKELLVFGEEYRFIRQKADAVSAAGIARVLDAVETARQRVRSNVNFHAAAEMLLLTIKEN